MRSIRLRIANLFTALAATAAGRSARSAELELKNWIPRNDGPGYFVETSHPIVDRFQSCRMRYRSEAMRNAPRAYGDEIANGPALPNPDALRAMPQTARELPRYRCHKEVWALKIYDVVWRVDLPHDRDFNSCDLHFEEPGYAPITVDYKWVGKHNPQPGGYFVVYKDGYRSYSPAQAFEDGYTRI